MALEPGQTLAHYRIVAKLGEGGMGVVWKAEDTKLGRWVALKVLPDSFAEDPDRLARFQGEARAVAALNHPNIVTLHSVEEADGTHFLTMELVEGRPLGTVIPPSGFPMRHFFPIAIPLSGAVQAAHEKGVSHRDLKPANIMLGPEGLVKVLDFGLAKLRPGAGGSDPSLAPTAAVTAQGMVMGTAAYMSPEQMTGAAADARSDIYSLGIILYEMAAGRRPFEGESFAEHASAVLRDEPPALHEVEPSVPRQLGRIVHRCLEKDPGRRFQTSRDLHVELENLESELRENSRERAVAEGRIPAAAPQESDRASSPEAPASPPAIRPPVPPPPVSADPSQETDRRPEAGQDPAGAPVASPPARPSQATPVPVSPDPAPVPIPSGRPSLWPVAAVVLLLVAVLVLWWVWGRDRADSSPDTGLAPGAEPTASRAGGDATPLRIAVLPFENLGAPDDAYFAAGMTEEITSRLAAVRALAVISRTTATQYDRSGKTLRAVGADLGVDYVLEGTVRWDRTSGDIGRVRVTPQLIRVADDTHVWADRYDESLEDLFAVQTRVAQRVLGALNIELLEPEKRAIEARPTEDLEAYEAYLRGQELELVGVYDEETRLRTIRMYERAVQLDPEFTIAWCLLSRQHSHMNILGMDRSPERTAEARAALDEALAQDPDLPQTQLALGYFHYHALREYEPALAAFERARERLPNDSDLLSAIGFIRRRQGRWEESLDYLKRALELDPRASGLTREVGNNLLMMRRYMEAVEYFDGSIALRPDSMASYAHKAIAYLVGRGDLDTARGVLEQMPPSTAMLPTWVGFLVEWDGRDFEAALAHLDAYPSDRFVMPGDYVPKALVRSEVLRRLGRAPEADAALDEAEGMIRQELEARPDDPRLQSVLGVILARRGQAEEAIRLGRRGVELFPVDLDALHGPHRLLDLAVIHVILERPEDAVEILRSLLSIESMVSGAGLRLDPRWDPIRESAAFQDLLTETDG